MTEIEKAKTHFGHREVAWDEKKHLVGDVFSSVARKYDLMNDLMSMGMHRLWKRDFVGTMNPQPGRKYIDVAGGTGDIARLIAAKIGNDNPESRIVVADINNDMLSVGRNRFIDENLEFDFEFLNANAESMPVDDMQFDAYTIAFGIRNVTDIPAALKEAYRILKPGGRFMCLEFSKVEHNWLERIYEFYSFKIIPEIGERVAKDRESYQYLVESIQKFPDADSFENMIKEAGFSNTSHRHLSGGIVAIHSGWRI